MTGASRVLLAFLDVITCGLGAAILLFLIYVALPHEDASAGEDAGAGEPEGAPDPDLEELDGRGVSIRVVDVTVPRGLSREEVQGSWDEVPDGCVAERGFTPPDQLTFLLMCPEPLSVLERQELALAAPRVASLEVSALAYQGAYALGDEGAPVRGTVPSEAFDRAVDFRLHMRRPIRLGGK